VATARRPERDRARESELSRVASALIRSAPLAAPTGVAILSGMATTRQLPRENWQAYFDRFTREHLKPDRPGAATVEVISPAFGDQVEEAAARLLGLTYDPKSEAFEVLLEDIDHLVFHPNEIWILEGEPGLIATIEVVAADGSKEIIYVRNGGAPAGADATAPH